MNWPFHSHRWVTIAAEQATNRANGGDVTILLQRCEACGQVQTKWIDGLWTRDQLVAK